MKRAPTIFFAVAALTGVTGFMQLGAHQSQAGKLAKAITETDKAGGVVTGQQQELASYVRAHMRTSASYMLEGSYNRAAERAQAAAAGPGSNGQVYASAQAACAGRADSIAQARCVQNYLTTHATPAASPQPVLLPSKSDYTTKLVGPGWTADSAGLALLLAVISVILALYSAAMRRFI
ncbi:MAG TPA: hypothetical protein VMR98_00485 [Candidatus Polarisedimenticolaceae bacterium]|nr:hypothetical protein [Candidatus Polarisedimenticolaceae bacterium]